MTRARSQTVSFSLNGRRVAVEQQPLQTLAGTLRDDLGLTGTKIGCDAGDCGACTIVMNGAPVDRKSVV